MKIILYMAITANGYIAKENDETPWSKDEWKEYVGNAKKTHCMIIGRRTYDIWDKTELTNLGIPVLVLSKKINKSQNNIFFIKSIKEALEVIKSNKYLEVMIAGGGKVNGEFFKRGLIDELFLDVEPFIFGQGIPLFSPCVNESKLELLDSKKIGKNGMQLHYKVLKI